MIAEFETRLLAQIDDLVEHGSDDDLFAGGYLGGHITLAVAEAEAHGESSPEALKARVESSIEQAIKAGELAPRDRQLVLDLWKNLYSQNNASCR